MMAAKESSSFIFTPVSPDKGLKSLDRSIRYVSSDTKIDAILRNLTQGMNVIEGTQPLMMQFLRYITYEKSSVPEIFLLPLEQKLILFNENRQR